jgi:hypothetical protein
VQGAVICLHVTGLQSCEENCLAAWAPNLSGIVLRGHLEGVAGLKTHSAGARSFVCIVINADIPPPACAVALAAPCLKGSNAQIVTFAKFGAAVFLIDANGPKGTFRGVAEHRNAPPEQTLKGCAISHCRFPKPAIPRTPNSVAGRLYVV